MHLRIFSGVGGNSVGFGDDDDDSDDNVQLAIGRRGWIKGVKESDFETISSIIITTNSAGNSIGNFLPFRTCSICGLSKKLP